MQDAAVAATDTLLRSIDDLSDLLSAGQLSAHRTIMQAHAELPRALFKEKLLTLSYVYCLGAENPNPKQNLFKDISPTYL